MRAYAQSGQYHTIVESRVRLTLGSKIIGYCLPPKEKKCRNI